MHAAVSVVSDLRHGVTLEVCRLVSKLNVDGLTTQLWMTVFRVVAEHRLTARCHFRYLCRCSRLHTTCSSMKHKMNILSQA